jgi:putative addiction module CopG family antidote
MMKVSFAEVDEAYLRGKVEGGDYSSLSEAIRDMVRKQREREQHRLLAALELGERDIRDGRTQPLTKTLFDETVQSGLEAAKRGDGIWNPDVRPQ